MKENDKRVIKTKENLKKSLAELLLKKSIDKITISELAKKANISRNAFYSHYEDIFALFDEMETEFFNNFENLLHESVSHDYIESLDLILNHIHENNAIVRVFATVSDGSEFRSKLHIFLEEQITKITLYEMESTILKEDWKYMIRYHSSGVVSLFLMWIESNFIYPKEKLLQIITEIDELCDPMYKP